jgi:hypothetical protein
MQKGINNRYHILLDGKGYIVKPYSPKVYPDSDFISRYTGGDPDLVGQPRIPKWFQDDWSHGQGQEFIEDPQMFDSSFGIDVTGFSKIELAKKFDSATYDGSTAEWTKPVVFDGKVWAGKGAAIFYSSDGTTWADSGYTPAHTITDLEVFKNKLYACKAGTSSDNLLEHTAGEAVSAWAAVTDSGLAKYAHRWGDYLYIVSNNLVKNYDDTDFVTIKDFTGATDVSYIFKKPRNFAQILYIPANIDSDTGPSRLFHYDLENLFEVDEHENPMGDDVAVYNNRLIYAVFSDKYVDFYSWNGSSSSLLYYIEQPTNAYTNVTFSKLGSKLYCILTQAGTPSKYMLVYDTSGWSFQSSLPVNDAIGWKLGVFNKKLYAFGGNGNIYKLSTTEHEATGELISSWFDINLLDIQKLLANFTANLEPLPTNTSVQALYQLEDEGAFASIVTESTTGATQATTTFPVASNTVKGVKIRLKLKLSTTTAANTPVVKDSILGFLLAPTTRRSFDYVVVATRNMKLLDGTLEPRTAEQIVNDLWTSKTDANIIELVNKYGTFNVMFAESTPNINDPHPGELDQEALITIRLYVIK